jgi:hypothetical protein
MGRLSQRDSLLKTCSPATLASYPLRSLPHRRHCFLSALPEPNSFASNIPVSRASFPLLLVWFPPSSPSIYSIRGRLRHGRPRAGARRACFCFLLREHAPERHQVDAKTASCRLVSDAMLSSASVRAYPRQALHRRSSLFTRHVARVSSASSRSNVLPPRRCPAAKLPHR